MPSCLIIFRSIPEGILVDAEDADWVNQWSWYRQSNGYAVRNIPREGGGQKGQKLHRALAERWEWEIAGKALDHINGNKLDNRHENLRLCTTAENKRNCEKYRNNTSGFKGVHKNGSRWQAEIRKDKEGIYLGTFGTPEEAAIFYDLAAIVLHGEFAHTNLLNPADFQF